MTRFHDLHQGGMSNSTLCSHLGSKQFLLTNHNTNVTRLRAVFGYLVLEARWNDAGESVHLGTGACRAGNAALVLEPQASQRCF